MSVINDSPEVALIQRAWTAISRGDLSVLEQELAARGLQQVVCEFSAGSFQIGELHGSLPTLELLPLGIYCHDHARKPKLVAAASRYPRK